MADYYANSANAAEWAASAAKNLGDRVVCTIAYGTAAAKKYVYECTVAGTTGGTQPTWPTTPGNTVADNDITWTCRECTTQANASRYAHYLINNRLAAGDRLFVKNTHSELISTLTILSPGSMAAPIQVLSHSDAAEPPTTLAAGAVIGSTGSSRLTYYGGSTYSYGIEWSNAVGGSFGYYGLLGANAASTVFVVENGSIRQNNNDSVLYIGNDAAHYPPYGTLVRLINSTLKLRGSGIVMVDSRFEMFGGSLAYDGGTNLPSTLITPSGRSANLILFDGVDLSLMGSGKNLIGGASDGPCRAIFRNCKLGASVTKVSGTIPNAGSAEIEFVNCSDGDTNYEYDRYLFGGSVVEETTVRRNGGASDGTTPISDKYVTLSSVSLVTPFIGNWMQAWNESTGASKTLTIHYLHGGATALDNDDIWPEVMALTTSGFPLASLASGRKADVLASASAWAADTAADWDDGVAAWAASTAYSVGDIRRKMTGDGSVFICTVAGTSGGSEPSWPANDGDTVVDGGTLTWRKMRREKISVGFTPQEKGPVRARVCVAAASLTVWVCPKFEIT